MVPVMFWITVAFGLAAFTLAPQHVLGAALPDDLRARIFYLAEFTDQHTRKVLNGRDTAGPLIEINTAIMRGLRPAPEAVA